MTKFKPKRRLQEAFAKNRVSEVEADRREVTPNSLLTGEFLAAKLKIHPVTLRLWRLKGKGPPHKVLNPESPPSKHVVRYLWRDVLKWMDGPEKQMLPPDPSTLTGMAKAAFFQSRGSTFDEVASQIGTPGIDALGDMAQEIEDEDEDPHAVETDSVA